MESNKNESNTRKVITLVFHKKNKSLIRLKNIAYEKN